MHVFERQRSTRSKQKGSYSMVFLERESRQRRGCCPASFAAVLAWCESAEAEALEKRKKVVEHLVFH